MREEDVDVQPDVQVPDLKREKGGRERERKGAGKREGGKREKEERGGGGEMNDNESVLLPDPDSDLRRNSP